MSDDTRRDRWGRYLVRPPGVDKPVGYTRVTTVAKTLDDGGGLIPWKATATVVGALRRPGLLARWQQLVTAASGDPWYDSPDTKDKAKKLVEECATAGGSSDRAEMGTALHAFVEAHLHGDNLVLLPGMQADIDAFDRTVTAAGIVFDHTVLEATVVLDDYKVAGTADQLCVELPGHGLVVSDLKTGTDLKYSWQAIAVQLAAYAHADRVYVQGATPADDRWEPLPAISHQVGLVIHLPAGEGRCELHLVDLVAGWEAFQLSIAARTWRSNTRLTKPYKIPTQGSPAPSVGPVGEGRRDLPSPTPVPAPMTPADEYETVAVRPAPTEGATVDDATFDVLKATYRALPVPAREWIAAITLAATQHSAGFNAEHIRSVRRYEIIRALVLLAQDQPGPVADQDVRDLLEPIIGPCAQYPTLPVGWLIGTLSHVEASQFSGLLDHRYVLSFTDDGTPRIAPAA